MKDISLQLRKPTVADYQALRKTTGWSSLDDETVGTALKNDIFSICIAEGNKAIGMGRVVGDGAAYFYIQDVIVHPHFQKQGIGKMIMNEIEGFLAQNAPNNAFIGLMAAEGVERFYNKYNYRKRPSSRPGMFKTISA